MEWAIRFNGMGDPLYWNGQSTLMEWAIHFNGMDDPL
jgi:hypothetical protein